MGKPQNSEDEFLTPEEVAETDQQDPHVVDDTKASQKPSEQNKYKRFFAAYWAKKKWTLPVTVVGLLAVLLLVPVTRYAVLGLFVKGDVTISVVDSKTKSPVSSAIISLKGTQFKTDANGKVTGKAKLGSGTLTVEKQYYTTASQPVTVTLSQKKNVYAVSLAATGRQVPITVVNKITGKPVANALLVAAKTEVKTDKQGKATLVLPTSSTTETAKLTLNGYNTQEVKVNVTDAVVPENTFSIVPAGTVYFLSKQTGKIDVVKTDLDGGNRQVVLAGTGTEDEDNMLLLASQDWKYLALHTRRDSTLAPAKLYLIDTTAGDKLTVMDEGDATFGVHGWSGHNFFYTVSRNTVKYWQPKYQSLKMFNADNKQLIAVEDTNAEGSAYYDYKYELITGVTIMKDSVSYVKYWSRLYYNTSLEDKQDAFFQVNTNGQGKKTLKTLPAQTVSYIIMNEQQPDEALFTVNMTDQTVQYFELSGETLKPVNGLNGQNSVYRSSPSGKQTFWAESRDGKNSFFIGDADGNRGKEIASLTDYNAYGWFTDDYLLVSKNNSELYIMGTNIPITEKEPLKVSDYHKFASLYDIYGGGYGGY